MGNQASVCSPSQREATKPASIEEVWDEAGKLFAMESLGDERRHAAANDTTQYRSNSHLQRALQNSNSSSRCNLHEETENTLRSILEAASRGFDLVRDEDADSDSTRDTCDSPLFPPRTSRSKVSRRNTNHTDMKIHPRSLLAHLGVHPTTSDIRRDSSDASNNRRSSFKESTKNNSSSMIHQRHQPPPIFPDLTVSSNRTDFLPDYSTTAIRTRSNVVKIPHRNKQQYQAEIEEEEHLKRLYDSRTWTMYKRITEARAARQTPAAAAHIGNLIASVAPRNGQEQEQQQQTFEINNESPCLHGSENLAAGYPPAEDDEMVFGDLED